MIGPHTCYCEPFAGGLAVLLAKPRSPVEVVNDINGDLVALYRCVQFHLPELLRELDHLVSSRQIMKEFVGQPGVTDIQRAARFYYRNRISFGGGMQNYGVSRTGGGGAIYRRQTNRDLLGPLRDRLDGVMVEHLSYERCMALYDSPDSFFFLDPPYLNAKPNAYAGWNEEQMRAFRDHVYALKGKWIVTVDDSAFNRELFAGCTFRSFRSRNGAAKTAAKSTFQEIVITPADLKIDEKLAGG